MKNKPLSKTLPNNEFLFYLGQLEDTVIDYLPIMILNAVEDLYADKLTHEECGELFLNMFNRIDSELSTRSLEGFKPYLK